MTADERINAVRVVLPRCWFDAEETARGLDALRQYSRAWSEERKLFGERPAHDWTSHAADAFRYLAAGLRESQGAAPTQAQAIEESAPERFGLLGTAAWEGGGPSGGYAVGMRRRENGVTVECGRDGRWRQSEAIAED